METIDSNEWIPGRESRDGHTTEQLSWIRKTTRNNWSIRWKYNQLSKRIKNCLNNLVLEDLSGRKNKFYSRKFCIYTYPFLFCKLKRTKIYAVFVDDPNDGDSNHEIFYSVKSNRILSITWFKSEFISHCVHLRRRRSVVSRVFFYLIKTPGNSLFVENL